MAELAEWRHALVRSGCSFVAAIEASDGGAELDVARASEIRQLTDVLPCNLHETCLASNGMIWRAAGEPVPRPQVSAPGSASWR